MLEQKVNVTNNSDRVQRLVDIGLPGMRREIVLQPGESADIPADVWIRKMRTSWLVRTSSLRGSISDSELFEDVEAPVRSKRRAKKRKAE